MLRQPSKPKASISLCNAFSCPIYSYLVGNHVILLLPEYCFRSGKSLETHVLDDRSQYKFIGLSKKKNRTDMWLAHFKEVIIRLCLLINTVINTNRSNFFFSATLCRFQWEFLYIMYRVPKSHFWQWNVVVSRVFFS